LWILFHEAFFHALALAGTYPFTLPLHTEGVNSDAEKAKEALPVSGMPEFDRVNLL
jgi:hypothetical protein